jgi:hypothetical protein
MFMLSPRFFALPVIALAIIIALAQASNTQTRSTGTEMAAPKLRATTCTTPARTAEAACAVARDGTSLVR